jgi:asparagine synthase (glutamine-hydrolysing)
MCGICGKIEFDKDSLVSRELVIGMANAIHHRGPDDEGYYVSGPVGLGFRRLSIIDLSGGHQPLCNEDGSIWIVFNGEIYNYRELRRELLAKGHVFRSESDTEVIVHLYEEYGTDCVQKLRGMFAFAIWDGAKRTLFLARDRVGIKPLYYYKGKDFLSFGSEMKAILSDSAVDRDVDPKMIDRFLTYYYVPGSETLLRNIAKLEPGYLLTVKDGEIKTWPYWDLDFSHANDHQSSGDLEQQLIELLDQSVQLHMISDVPIGFLLSGGLDSTAMLSLAAKKTDKPISTFTVGFSAENIVDERPFARLAANRFGSKHYEISISPDQFLGFLPGYVWHMEEPVCEPPAIALYYVSKLASQYVKVLISGEGADEAFAGYENFRNNFWFENIKRLFGPLQNTAGQVMTHLGGMFHSRVLQKYGPRMSVRFEEYYLSRTSSPFGYFTKDSASLYTNEMARMVDKKFSASVTQKYLADAAHFGLLEKMLYVDTKTWLPDDLLIKADRMTMANSVELRVPFLDHKVLEFAASLPRNQKVRGWKLKYLAKKALSGYVPDEILSRKKAGFPIPYDSWLRSSLRSWVSDLLLDQKAISRGYFKRSAIEELIRRNICGTGYPKDIFALVVLEIWHRTFVDQRNFELQSFEETAGANA